MTHLRKMSANCGSHVGHQHVFTGRLMQKHAQMYVYCS